LGSLIVLSDHSDIFVWTSACNTIFISRWTHRCGATIADDEDIKTAISPLPGARIAPVPEGDRLHGRHRALHARHAHHRSARPSPSSAATDAAVKTRSTGSMAAARPRSMSSAAPAPSPLWEPACSARPLRRPRGRSAGSSTAARTSPPPCARPSRAGGRAVCGATRRSG
jgi:hypothetical protein